MKIKVEKLTFSEIQGNAREFVVKIIENNLRISTNTLCVQLHLMFVTATLSAVGTYNFIYTCRS